MSVPHTGSQNKAVHKVPNKQFHRDRRSLVPILYGKIVVPSYFNCVLLWRPFCKTPCAIYYSFVWCWYNSCMPSWCKSSVVYILVRVVLVEQEYDIYLLAQSRMVKPLGGCWHSMGMAWYVVRYGVAWCAVWHDM